MQPVIAKRSIRHYAWGVVLAVALLLVSEMTDVSRGISVPVVLLIGLASPLWALARAVTGAGEVLRIDDGGITDARLPVGRIPWDQVTGAQTRGSRVYVTVRNPEMLGLRSSVWRRLNEPLGLGGGKPGVYVKLDGLDVPAHQVAAAIHERLSLLGTGAEPEDEAVPVAWGADPSERP